MASDIYSVEFEPIGKQVHCLAGITIFEAALESDIPINSECGGMMTCGKCKVRVLSGDVSPLSESEKALLSEKEIATGIRLACAARVMGNLRLELPKVMSYQSLQLTGREPSFNIDPIVSRYKLNLTGPTLSNPIADWDNICKALKNTYGLKKLLPDWAVLQNIPEILRNHKWQIEVIVRNNEVLAVRPQKPDQKLLGVAIDLGSTKIAGLLVDLETGETLSAKGLMNPQIPYGDDVMSRISYAARAGGLKKLRKVVTQGLNDLIRDISGDPDLVMEVVIVGNTAMHHFFLGLPVTQLGRAPYIPVVSSSLDFKARDVGLNAGQGAYVHVLPNIGGFVGADHVAMILAAELYKTPRNVIGIDIGTNTEIALASGGKIRSLSCASGPAFEGATVKHGMRASIGAVTKVTSGKEGICVDVVGDSLPVGICGSGILDAMYQLRQQQIIDRRGRLQNGPMVRDGANGHEYVLVKGDNSGTGEDIVVTQQDLGEIQLAKAAIRAGINILLFEAGLKETQIDEFIIAGAFGSHIDVTSAIGIGMFPDLPLERFTQAGNLAGVGAKLALVSKIDCLMTEKISKQVKYIELIIHPNYSREFSRSLMLP